ncbi:MAG: recombinase RecT [Akkermansiaceae bacterium]|nr:recombinase RecT [Akkermansiaceae bacterium]
MTPQAIEKVTSGKALVALTGQLGLADPRETYDVLMSTVMPTAKTYEEVAAFALVCSAYKLNPLVKEVYAFPTKQGGIMPMVGIDGWLKIAHSHPDYAGMAWSDGADEKGELWCECTVYLRSTPEHPVTIREYMSECKMNTQPWQARPRRMLRHRATIQAIRYALGIAGILDQDDMAIEEAVPGSMQMRKATVLNAGEGLTPAPAAEEPKPEPKKRTRRAPEPAPEPEPAPAPAYKSTFSDLLAELEHNGRTWRDAAAFLREQGVTVPAGGSPEEFDHFAEWLRNQKPLRDSMIDAGFIEDTLL